MINGGAKEAERGPVRSEQRFFIVVRVGRINTPKPIGRPSRLRSVFFFQCVCVSVCVLRENVSILCKRSGPGPKNKGPTEAPCVCALHRKQKGPKLSPGISKNSNDALRNSLEFFFFSLAPSSFSGAYYNSFKLHVHIFWCGIIDVHF